MAKTNITEVTTNDTFQVWLSKTNELLDLMGSDVMTASPSGDTTIGDAILDGDFSATNITVTDNITTDTFGVNEVALPSTSSNPYIDTTSKIRFSSSDANPVVIENASGPKVLIKNNTANWLFGLADNTASSKFVITTSGIVTPLLRVSTSGDMDISGNFATIGNITGDEIIANTFTGNASSASKLADTFTISIGGDLSYTSSGIDGSNNVTNNATIIENAVSNTKFRKSVALSIVGRSANSLGNIADIAATNDHQVLRRSGSSLGFGAINLAQSSAVSGSLSVSNGGTGATSLASGGILIGNGTGAILTDSSLVFDTANNRLGVGITPQYAVDVDGDVRATLFRGVATSAQYTGLADKFVPDEGYEYGTVVCVGGVNEITATGEADYPIGVISQNPAIMMNSGITGLYVTLKGRVIVKINGEVEKGDMLIPSSVNGYAKKSTNINDYNIFGIALEDSHDGVAESVIL